MNNEPRTTNPEPAAPPPYWIPNADELLAPCELADRLKRSERYISAMRRDGFAMPGGRATLNHALQWLAENPDFRQNRKKI
jgi:hypothetical protein